MVCRKFVLLLFIYLLSYHAFSKAPELASFQREQRVNLPTSTDPMIRIWSIYVGQGDAFLIQIPKAFCQCEEDYEILIDGGTVEKSFRLAALNFLKDLYPNGATIESVVISHHDQDHVAGLSPIFESNSFKFKTIFHNGLASYNTDAFDITPKQGDDDKIYSSKGKNEKITRFMGEINPTDTLNEKYTVNSLQQLKILHANEKLQGVYETLASSIIVAATRNPDLEFKRARLGSEFINNDFNRSVSFDLLWPEKTLRSYQSNWGKTINGNSVVFNFHYNDFSMLFTGDLNKPSTERIEDVKKDIFNTRWSADILKAPHHGSRHVKRSFYKRKSNPFVLAVGSNGDYGFVQHKHPGPEAIKWMGGAHRFYNTSIHERKFSFRDLHRDARRKFLDEVMSEHSHVLIETDGNWFRVVEVPAVYQDILSKVLSVDQVRRSNGTRWIKATAEVQ